MRQGSSSASASAVTDSNGHYLSPLLNPGSYYVVAGGGTFTTVVYPDGTCSSPYSCTPSGGSLVPVTLDGATTGIDLQLKPAQSRLTGTIRDRAGTPLSNLMVTMRDSNGYYISAYNGPAWTDTNGHYDFGIIPAGTYYPLRRGRALS